MTTITPTIVWHHAKLQGWNTARPSTENWIKNVLSTLKVYPKAQIPPQPVPTIRILPQASYPYPSKGTQNENHNHRKLTKLITWITALSNSMKL